MTPELLQSIRNAYATLVRHWISFPPIDEDGTADLPPIELDEWRSFEFDDDDAWTEVAYCTGVLIGIGDATGIHRHDLLQLAIGGLELNGVHESEGEWVTLDFCAFVHVNLESLADDDAFEAIVRLAPGETFTGGGGASPEWSIRRVAASP